MDNSESSVKKSTKIVWIVVGVIVAIIVVVILLNAGGQKDLTDRFMPQGQGDDKALVDDGGVYEGKVSATNQYAPSESGNGKNISYTISAVADLKPQGEINKVLIKNVHLEKMPSGEVALLLPTGEYNKAFANDGSDVIGLMAVSEGEQYSANKIGKTSAPLFVQIKATNAYSFDVADVAGPHRSFQYAQVDPVELDNTLTFDVEVELASGTVITKTFTGNVIGTEFAETGSMEANPLEVQ